MECVRCKFKNRKGAKFCKNCGAKLELVCPSCGYSCDSDSAFCDECGHDLRSPTTPALPKNLSFDDKLTKIQTYLPNSLTEKSLGISGLV